MWGRISTKCDNKLGNMIEKIWHTLQESHVWGSNYNITSVSDLNMWYFISLIIIIELLFTAIDGPNMKWNCNLPHGNPYSTLDDTKLVL